jgi:hypothetical protein
MRHQAGHPGPEPFVAHEASAVERMEARNDKARRVSDVVQPRSRHKSAVHAVEALLDLRGPPGNPTDVSPPTRPCLSKKGLRHRMCSLDVNHPANLSTSADTAIAAV